MSESERNTPDAVTALPVDVSPERAIEVGDYFSDILADHGQPAKILVGGRIGVHEWDGVRASFEAGNQRYVVERFDQTDIFPEIKAFRLDKVDSPHKRGSKIWQRGDEFTFNLRDHTLTYNDGRSLLFVFSDKPLRPGVTGVQRAGRWGGLTVNVTPPNSEGVVTMLDGFLDDAGRIINESARLRNRTKSVARKIGRRARKLALGT